MAYFCNDFGGGVEKPSFATKVKVERGDNLRDIAANYLESKTGVYPTEAEIDNQVNKMAANNTNAVKNTNFVSPGQTLNITTPAPPPPPAQTKPIILQFGVLSTDDGTLFATWNWDRANTASYKVSWTYDIGTGTWFNGNTSTITIDKDDPELSQQSLYSIPQNARKVRFKVKPISETKTSNNTTTNYWEASWSDVKTWTVTDPLTEPGTPSVEIDKFKLTASLDNIEINGATHIEFQVIKDNASTAFATGKAAIVSGYASYAFTISAGSQYKVRCRAYSDKENLYSPWSSYTSNQGTIPSTPETITDIRAMSTTSVSLSWSAVANATGYTIEYTTKKIYFDSSTEVKSMSVGEGITTAIVTGMNSGEEYFFRVKATNDTGTSGWSEIKSIVIGKPPAAPTTWSSTTTAIVGNPVTFYWVHNSEDGSSQTYAELQVYIGDTLEEYTIKNSEEEDEKDKTSKWVLNTSPYPEGTSVKWRVRTAGVTKEYGEWSIQRTVDIYAPATLELTMTDINGNTIETLNSFPFYIKALAGPKTQTPIGYHLSIKSNEVYETVDSIGNSRTVNKDEELYSKYFDINDPLLVEMSAGNVDLENNIEYTVTCKVSMNTGLTAEVSIPFTVTWTEYQYIPNAQIGVDEDTMVANIMPYCESVSYVKYQVTESEGVYTKTSTVITHVYGSPLADAYLETGERVYFGTIPDGSEIYYCTVEEKTPVTDVLLSVYRREFDGSFTELATGLDSAKSTTVTDPHPALDLARYRIVATTKSTGAVGYYDPPGYPIGGKAVIIQWDEEWSNFETSEENAMEQPNWTGSLLRLPYNIDVSESNNSDVSMIEYAGRSHPVTYYGTQLGVSANWNVEIPKDDKETIYALRRLARWTGDAYVREPSGSGYWANVTVSFSQKHCELTIPVSIRLTQVEGGI